MLAVDELDADELSVEPDDAVPDSFFVSAAVDDFELLLYRSAYQPPPLNETAGA